MTGLQENGTAAEVYLGVAALTNFKVNLTMKNEAFKFNISTKLILLLLGASVIPLLIFGGLSLSQVQKATVISVTQGHERISEQAAGRIDQYVSHAVEILKALSENIHHADLQSWQEERIIKNYHNRFDEYNDLSILDPEGAIVATSFIGKETYPPDWKAKAFQAALTGEPYLSSVYIRSDLNPAMMVAFPIMRLNKVEGILMGELNLLQMWYLVDAITIGKTGVIHVIDNNGQLLATGDGSLKKKVLLQESYISSNLIDEIVRAKSVTFINPKGEEVVASGTRLKDPLQWSVLVEQPTHEAYALASEMILLLIGIMGIIFIFSLVIGFWGGRKGVVNPIKELLKGTSALAEGNLEYRVELMTNDEFADLAQGFNNMVVRLKDVQEQLVKQERHAMFGRIASGLAHDLKHPIQAIETSSKLMERLYDDAEFRKTFHATVQREFAKINGFIRDLHNLTHEIPHSPVDVPLGRFIEDAASTFKPIAQENNIELLVECDEPEREIRLDPQTLNRALSNLMSNAIQAMESDGQLRVTGHVSDTECIIAVHDTGPGIPPDRLKSLFEDFVTTKHRGLGLGLAITKKIIQQHLGQIEVKSEVGKGTSFIIMLPLQKTS